jgi:hypothetical protein
MSRPTPTWAWLAAGGLGLLLLGGKGAQRYVQSGSASQALNPFSDTRWTWGRPNGVDPWGNVIYRDPTMVVPALADKVERIIRRLQARGFDAVVAEGYRTEARARALDTKGTGITKSLHRYNGAVDIVDRLLGWGASKAFKDAVVEEVEREGLMSGRRFTTKDDWAHAQAVFPAQTVAFINAGLEQRNRMVA